ncbi:WD repeat protein WDR4 [Phaffia rhodozyma]|uniref:WD repeat protein WDR4 n=1 Tax=Phaffia rhodozyma TaxID=264483 RepID=A0A0F7SND9_PHARH|nr:WD repeat protein WDR4 [Phaffia rhodozyma]
MPFYPLLNLTATPDALYLSSGPDIVSFDPDTGHALATTSGLEPTADSHSGLVRNLAVSTDGKWVASFADDKALKVWEVSEDKKTLRLASTRSMFKKIATLGFTKDNSILIGDKLGDAFRYPLHPKQDAETVEARKKFDIHADPALNPDATLILGHTSPITSLFLTPDEQYVVTSDRDEHIRISRYPQGFVAERFILGHKKFISSLLKLSTLPLLLSAGGDSSIHVWSFPAGELQTTIPILETVRPFITVFPPKRYGRKRDGVESRQERLPDNEGLVVTKMVEVGSRVVFLSLGATALFSIPITDDMATDQTVSVLEFNRPVLDFTPRSSSTLLVSLDEVDQDSIGLHAVDLSTETWSKLSEPDEFLKTILSQPTPSNPLPLETSASSSNNGKGKGKDERSKGGAGLNLYQPLVELPKWPAEPVGEDEDEKIVEDQDRITKKELGRRKNNGGKASSALLKKLPRSTEPSALPTSTSDSTPTPSAIEEAVTVANEPAKRAKVEHEDVDEAESVNA